MENLGAKQSTRIYGFDYIRAAACVFVVAFHISPFSMQNYFAKMLHVFLFASAVPIFILISLFLAELRGFSFEYVVSKSRRLFKVYALWGWMLPAMAYFVCNLLNTFRAEISLKDGLNLYDWIFNGLNWPLKVHGIYFIPFLFILTWIYLFLKLYINSYTQAKRLFLILTILNFLLPFLPGNFEILRQSVVAFLIYIPLARILFLDYCRGCNYFKNGLFAFTIYLSIALLEGILIAADKLPLIPEYHYSPYGRLSIVFLATACLYWSFLIKGDVENFSETLRILVYCSLGVYLIHGFILDFFILAKYELPLFIVFSAVLSISVFLSSLIQDIPYVKKVLIL